MIHTSYFSNCRKFPKEMKTVSIALKSPTNGHERYSQLAPNELLLYDYKYKGIGEEVCTDRYKKEVLSKLNVNEVAKDLENCVLLCYEKCDKFCHRHIVAEWLSNAGYEVSELD